MENSLVTPLVATATAIFTVAVTQWITVRKDDIKFRREKAEEFAKSLHDILEALYRLIDDSVTTSTEKEVVARIRAQAQLLSRATGRPEVLMKMYFPSLEQCWLSHRQKLEALACYVDARVGNQNADWSGYTNEVKQIFTSHDEIIKTIILLYPQLTRDWLHTLTCSGSCCR